MVGPDEAAPPALNAPVMKGSGQFDAVGGAGSVPVMRPTASKSAWTRLSGSGEYPSFPAASWPAHAKNSTYCASTACFEDGISDCSAMRR